MDNNEYLRQLNRFKQLYEQGNKKNRGLYMSEMEQIFNIPLLNNDAFNEANAEVIQLYRKFADWLFDENN